MDFFKRDGGKENQGERRFIQRDVYTNHVRIYHQIGGIREVSLDIPKLSAIARFRRSIWSEYEGLKP